MAILGVICTVSPPVGAGLALAAASAGTTVSGLLADEFVRYVDSLEEPSEELIQLRSIANTVKDGTTVLSLLLMIGGGVAEAAELAPNLPKFFDSEAPASTIKNIGSTLMKVRDIKKITTESET